MYSRKSIVILSSIAAVMLTSSITVQMLGMLLPYHQAYAQQHDKENDNRSIACANQPAQKQGKVPPFCGQLKVIKQIEGGGTATPSQFLIHITGNNPSQGTFPGSSSGTTVTLGQGAYQVTESPISGYTPTYSPDCSGSITGGQTKTCIITNTFTPPAATLTVIKHVVNDNSGTLQASDFTMEIYVCGTSSPVSSFPGSESGRSVTLDPGPCYAVVERFGAPAPGYDISTDGVCAGPGGQGSVGFPLNPGDQKTCTYINNDSP